MLKDYQDKVEQSRLNHPLSSEQFESWLSNPVTKRFFADFEVGLISMMENLSDHGESNKIQQQALAFATTRSNYEHLSTWIPTELEGEQ